MAATESSLDFGAVLSNFENRRSMIPSFALTAEQANYIVHLPVFHYDFVANGRFRVIRFEQASGLGGPIQLKLQHVGFRHNDEAAKPNGQCHGLSAYLRCDLIVSR